MTSRNVKSTANKTTLISKQKATNIKYTSRPTEYKYESDVVLSSVAIPYGVYTIQNVNSRLYAGILGSVYTDPPDVRLREDENDLGIQWIVHERLRLGNNNIYTIRNVSNGKVLNVLDGSSIIPTNILTVDDGTTYDSHWIVVFLGDSRYYLQNLTSGEYMSADGDTDRSNIQTADAYDGIAGIWKFNSVLEMQSHSPIESNSYYIQSSAPESSIYMQASGEHDGSRIVWQSVVGDPPASASFKFFVTRVENYRNLYNIKCLNTDDKYVTVDHGSKGNGADIVVGQYPRSFDTRFYFDTVIRGEIYVIRNVNSNLYLTIDDSSGHIKQYSNPGDSNTTQWTLVPIDPSQLYYAKADKHVLPVHA